MTTQELIEKAKTEKLTDEETKQIFDSVTAELTKIKEEDPEKYLQLLKEMNAIIENLNKDIEAI